MSTRNLDKMMVPKSVVAIGASVRPGSVGAAVTRNLLAGGFKGDIHLVNVKGGTIEGRPVLKSVAELREPADLAVIAVRAPTVLGVAEQCGRRGVRSLVVITSGLDAAACADLLAVCRRHGMRLVGPDGFGVAVPGIGLDATFAACRLRPGVAGLMSQSGGVGVALAGQLSRLGVGISSFVSVGDKVAAGQTLLIIEAMKTFNPIKAPKAGTVVQILIDNGRPVEFGEPLMIVE